MKRKTTWLAALALGALLLPGAASSEQERELQGSGGFFKWHGDRNRRITHRNDFNNVGFVGDQRETNDPVCINFGFLNVVPDGANRRIKNVRAEGVGQSNSWTQDFNRQQAKLRQIKVGDISPELDLLAPEIEATYDFRFGALSWTVDPNLIGPGSGTHSAYSFGVTAKGRESADDLSVGLAAMDFGDWDHDDIDIGLPQCKQFRAQDLAPLLTNILPELLKHIDERPVR